MTFVSRETDEPAPAVLAHLFGERVEVVRRYAALLTGPGVERGLLGPREAARVWQRHILNCAVVESALPVGSRVCDLGSGAGLPGIVLALARPDLRVTLLEPLLRRTTFLGQVVAELGLSRVQVLRGRAEEVAGEQEFDVVTARAVAPLDRLARWSMPLLHPGGVLLALKGDTARAEVEAAGEALRNCGVAQVAIATYGAGLVEPVTTVVRLESSSKRPPH